MNKLRNFFLTLLLMFFSLSNAATNVELVDDTEVRVYDNGLGVEVRLNDLGQLLSIKSTFDHPVEFPDRRGIRKAYIIAEEKAKANIARFMEQTSSSTRIVHELDALSGQSTSSTTDGDRSWTKTNSRAVSESLTEITTSQAQATLNGVRIIDRSYHSEEGGYVVVVVGINAKSQSAAGALSSGGISDDSVNSDTGTPGVVPSERKRAKDYDEF